jgi:beta-glucuronidase
VRTRGAEILLNGEPLWLRGVNRHEDHPDWGLSIPEKLMRRDVQIIQSLGCNAVRGSHYPNHPTFLDLCDEAGLLFFAEVPGWQYSAHQLATSPTRELLAQTLQEMIAEQFNHPCIFTWSLHNECDTDVERLGEADVASATRALYALAHSLDETRLITHVSHRFWHDRYFDLADLVCLNEYIGWYVEAIEGADLPEYLRRMATLCPDKPILITEFGAEGLSGYHSMEGLKWSEEHQTAQLRDSIAAFAANAHVAGCFVWQYCDVNVHPGRSMRRARSLNNKGVVDEYRRPKMSFFAVREAFAEINR